MKKPLVEEWIERGKQDLNAAKILFSKKKYLDLVLFHIHQAVEKHIKGFLIYNGWEIEKNSRS
jgi:HEPN domain-containing protein